jgi:hypothetical protein
LTLACSTLETPQAAEVNAAASTWEVPDGAADDLA